MKNWYAFQYNTMPPTICEDLPKSIHGASRLDGVLFKFALKSVRDDWVLADYKFRIELNAVEARKFKYNR